jgi:hypothetical protein
VQVPRRRWRGVEPIPRPVRRTATVAQSDRGCRAAAGRGAGRGPESLRLRGLLAETYRRAGRLLEAARLYRDLHRPALAAKLAATGGDWYRPTPPTAPVTVPWLGESGPAMIEARMGDGRVGRFLLDTGVGEALLDPHLASAAGVTPFGEEAIHFPAGPAGRVEHGLLSQLALGELVIEGVPVQVYDTRAAMAGLLPLPVDGVIGSRLLSRLPVALDYARRELRLGDAMGGDSDETGTPFYWAADQYPLVPARLNDRLDTLLFLDTGLSSTAFGLSLSSAQAAKVELAPRPKGSAMACNTSSTPMRCAVSRSAPLTTGAKISPACCCNRSGWNIGSAFASAACSVTDSSTAAACGSTSRACASPSPVRRLPEFARSGDAGCGALCVGTRRLGRLE